MAKTGLTPETRANLRARRPKRVLGISLQENGDFSFDAASRVKLHVSSAIMDREQGASLCDDIWSEKENLTLITHKMSQFPELRNEIAKFLLQNGMARLFLGLFEGQKTFRVGGIMATKNDVFTCAQQITGHSDQAMIITEFAMPVLIHHGLVSNYVKYVCRRKVPYKMVDIQAIANDLLRQEVARSLGKVKERLVIGNGVNSVTAVAEQFGDIFRAVGIALTMLNDFEKVLHDIRLGVLANLDPAPLLTQKGSVPEKLMKHVVVQTLMTNWTFIQSALELRSEVASGQTPISPECDAYTFNTHASTVLSMLRLSERYVIVSKSEFLSTVGTRKIFDLHGVPVSTVVYDNAEMEPAAQAVIALEDMTLEGAMTIQEVPDRVSERVQGAYGSLAKTMSLSTASQTLADILRYAVESEQRVKPLYLSRLTDQDTAGLDLNAIAALSAEDVTARFDEAREGEVAGFTLVFSGNTDYLGLKLKSGSIIGSRFFTSDPVEYFLCVEEFSPKQTVSVPAQLIRRSAMNARIVGYDEDDFVNETVRGGYKIDALGVVVSGKIRMKELTSIRMGELAKLVVPFHNSEVYSAVEAVITAAYEIAKAIKDVPVQRRVMRMLAQYTLRCAQAIAPAFRAEIHNAIIERAAENVSYEDSVKLRAGLRQLAMSAYADVIAANVFIKLQGLSDNETVFDSLAREEEVITHWVDLGSDRT